jgi:glycosyltransferase involved in cell wall biosynthesis
MTTQRPRVALVQRCVPHYNLVLYQKLLASSRYDWEFIYGSHAGGDESGLATDAASVLPTRAIRNMAIGKAIWQRDVTHWLRQQCYDAVVFELGWQIISNVMLIRTAHKLGTVVVPWTKGIAESGRPRPKWRQWMERIFIRHCDALLVYGQVSADYFQAYGYPPKRIFIAQNTVDVRHIVEGIPVDRQRAGELRAQFGFKNEIIIGHLGRLVPQKHVDWIIEAFARVHASGLHVRLIIAGDGPERAALEALAQSSGAGSAIRFCGRVPEADVGAYFQIFDVFVSAYSAGLAILEAMAHGKITVITPESRPETELVQDNVTGIITQDYSVPALAEGLRRAVDSVSRGDAIGSAAQRVVLNRATMEKMVEAFDQSIECALERKISKK